MIINTYYDFSGIFSTYKILEKNDFVEVSKNLAKYRSGNNFVLKYQNNYIGRSGNIMIAKILILQ